MLSSQILTDWAVQKQNMSIIAGIEPWSPALQADSLRTELSRKPLNLTKKFLKNQM